MDDLEDFYEHCSDPDVTRYTSWVTHRSLQQAKAHLIEYVRDYGIGQIPTWGIVQKSEYAVSKLIGTFGFHHILPLQNQAEIGYTLSKAFWGRGFISEALLAVSKFGFEHVQLHSIIARSAPQNVASVRVLQKFGFRCTGSMIEHVGDLGIAMHLDIYRLYSHEFFNFEPHMNLDHVNKKA
jgi:ribosomal-protein-alanine N-acetyltransferase